MQFQHCIYLKTAPVLQNAGCSSMSEEEDEIASLVMVKMFSGLCIIKNVDSSAYIAEIKDCMD